MTVRDHLGRSLAVGGALAVLGAGAALTLTERALAVAPAAPAGVVSTPFSKASTGAPQTVGPDSTAPARTFTINVPAGDVQAEVRDIDITTSLTHAFPGDVEIELIHAGTTVLLKGGPTGEPSNSSQNIFLNAPWDDSGDALASDLSNADGGRTFVPQGSFGAFVGKPAAGDWTLRVRDTSAPGDLDGGTFNGWTLTLATQSAFASAPTDVAVPAGPAGSPQTIPDGTGASTSTINVTGARSYLWDANLTTNISHPTTEDLEVRLSHAARTVVITSGNSMFAPGLSGRTFDDSATTVVARNAGGEDLVPEGALAAFIGTDPNGPWTLEVKDLTPGDTGTFNGWSLALKATDAATTAPPVTPPVTPTPVTPPLAPPTPPLGVKRFAVAKNAKKSTVTLNLGWANGAGRVSYTATLSTKIGKKTARKVVKGSALAGPRTVKRVVTVPRTWKGRTVTVHVVLKNAGTTLTRTKVLRRF